MRRAFTLIELMVVIAVMLLLGGITLLFVPNEHRRRVDMATSQVQLALSTAKSRALREQVPCGVRFYTSDGGKTFDSYQMIARPDVLAPIDPNAVFPAKWNVYLRFPPLSLNQVKRLNGYVPQPPPEKYVVTQFGFDLNNVVRAGDMLRVGEESYRIESVNLNTNEVTLLDDVIPRYAVSSPQEGLNVCGNYQYIRGVAPVMGEPLVKLPKDTVVLGMGTALPCSTGAVLEGDHVDVVFSPSGQVVNALTGKIVLWVTDVNRVDKPQLVVVYCYTGGTVVRPVGPANDEFQYVRDGKGSD